MTLAIHALPKPVIAAINGAAVGIGATMTLAMDIRMASTEARIGFVFGRIGITPEAASSWFLPRIVGLQQALEWIYSADILTAEAALAGRLLRSVHAPDELLPAAQELARSFVEGPLAGRARPGQAAALPARRRRPTRSRRTCRTRWRSSGRRSATARRAWRPSWRSGAPSFRARPRSCRGSTDGCDRTGYRSVLPSSPSSSVKCRSAPASWYIEVSAIV